MKIAIVEDEIKLATVLQGYLQREGYETDIFINGGAALQAFNIELPDLILLDLMLPGVDGIEICRSVRTESSVPIIMLTAKVEEVDRLLGLEIGADDYICKPYSPREVCARVKAVLRRTGRATSASPSLVSIDYDKAKVSINGRNIELTAIELGLLHTMHAYPGRIFNRSQLIQHIYSDGRIVSDRTVDSHVKKLRNKLATANTAVEYIHSVYGIGYKFEEP